MMDLQVLVGDKEYRIAQLLKETVNIEGRAVHTGRHIMTCANGMRIVLPADVVPRMPCRTCATLKPINEPCNRTLECIEAQRKAEELVARMHSKGTSKHVS